MSEKYLLEININTDGDFSFNDNEKMLFIIDDFALAYKKLKDVFTFIIVNLKGKSYVIDRVNELLNKSLTLLDYNNFYNDEDIFIDLEGESVIFDFYLGNQSIYAEIKKIEMINEDSGILRISEISYN